MERKYNAVLLGKQVLKVRILVLYTGDDIDMCSNDRFWL
ncbi:hypothetical protein ADIARSV_1977 [Arcticibacter svalbardensis MN12-7]|uniref:Uncharacterized protein n=1 Tax=Arcticibacter svalbardensis MN12-7 TaxID=1150600 RepID=R9GSM9_9SPHI|nr:hypothetical protein ADIARSV_1977 [Arcticibacter svalbardensis MN12-7]